MLKSIQKIHPSSYHEPWMGAEVSIVHQNIRTSVFISIVTQLDKLFILFDQAVIVLVTNLTRFSNFDMRNVRMIYA